MRIPDSKIDEVRSASDIVDVISSVVALKKRGKSYLGLCPFHQEKTPSFTVSAEKQMYHCFGCGVGGNVFTFLMEHEKVSFVEAVRTLAERAGIALPAEGSDDRSQATENETLYTLCRRAALYFHDNLVNTVEGKLALEYFHHRGMTDETIRKFGLGYSMNGWDALVRYGEKEGLELPLLEKAGLVLRREDGSGWYDRFRGRAMFPIFSPSGRVIAFGARKLREEDPLGKYINSPETPIYDKSRSLYGLFQSKEAIREHGTALLVEGYLDLITPFQAGVQHIVASSGTALTADQIHLISRYTRNVVLVYDADSAGSKATIRGVDLIIENGLDVRVVSLPSGEDPDSFVRSHGGEAFRSLVAGAVSFLEFKADQYKAQGLLDTPEGMTTAVRGIVETIAKMKDELKRNVFIKSLSERYGIYESVLFRELENILGAERGRASALRSPVAGARTPGLSPRAEEKAPEGAVLPPERDLLKVLLEGLPGMAGFVFSHIRPEMVHDDRVRRIAEIILRHEEDGSPWQADTLAQETGNDDLQHVVADAVFSKYEISRVWTGIGVPDPWELARDCIVRMRVREIEMLLRQSLDDMKAEERSGGSLRVYQERIMALQQEKKEVLSGRLFQKEA